MGRAFKGMNTARKAMEDAASNVKTEKIINIDSAKIKDNAYNKNIPMTDLEELANDMQTVGIMEPVIVYDLGDGTYELVAGHRRREAWCNMLQHQTIPCIVKPYQPDSLQRFKEHAATNIQTREKDPHFWIAEIDAARELVRTQMGLETQDKQDEAISSLLGKGASRSQIRRYEGFKTLTPEMQSLLDRGVSVNTLYQAVSLSEEEQRAVVQHILGRSKEKGEDPDKPIDITRVEFQMIIDHIVMDEPIPKKRNSPRAPIDVCRKKFSDFFARTNKLATEARTEEEKSELRSMIEEFESQLEEAKRHLN